MGFKLTTFLLLLKFFLVNDLCAESNKLKKILQNDYLEKSLINKSNKKTKKISQVNKPSQKIIERDDLDRVIKNLWLIRNNFVLKWDKKLPDYGLESVLSEVFRAYGVKGVQYKILFVHTNLVTHQMIRVKEREFIFIISKTFAEQLDLTKQEISLLLLEAYVREVNNPKKVEKDDFSPTIGKNFKTELNKYISSKLKQMDSEIFNFKGTFESEGIVLKSMFNGLSSMKVFLKTYKRMLIKVNDLIKDDARFKYFSSKFPSPEIKLNWLEGMNVK